MAYDIRNLRLQNLMGGEYDELTPGRSSAPQYEEDYGNPTSPYTPGPGLEQVGAQQDSNAVLGPDGRPLEQESVIQTPTVTQVGAPKVDPNARTFKQTLDEMNEGYTPDYTSRDRNNRLLDAPPERGEPGWGRTLVAAGMSVKANDPIKTAEQVMYAPYYRDVEDWKTKADPYYKAAELENRQNINERTIVSNAATAYGTAERNRIAQENNDARNENVRQRNIIADYVARGAKVVPMPHSSTIWMTRPDGQPFNTGIPTGAMSEAEAIRARGEWDVKASQAAGPTIVNDSTGAGVVNPRDPNPTFKPIPGATGPVRGTGASGSGSNGPSQLEKNRVEQETMKQQRATDPGARDHMKADGKGGYTWKDRPVEGSVVNGWFGTGIGGKTITAEDVAAYDAYRLEANPDYKPRIKGLGPDTSKVPTAKPAPRVRPDPEDQGASMDTGEGSPEEPTVRYERSKSDKNKIRRTRDGGKTWEISTDGGRKWSK